MGGCVHLIHTHSGTHNKLLFIIAGMKSFTIHVELQPFCYTDYNYIVEIVTFNVYNYIIIFTTGTHAVVHVVGHRSYASYILQ